MFLYGFFTLLGLAGLFYSTDPYATKRVVGTILANWLLFILYLNYFQERRQIHLMIAIWLAANLAGTVYSTYDWHLGSGVGGAQHRYFLPRQQLTDSDQDTQTTRNRWTTVYGDISEWDALGGSAVRRSMGPTSHPAVYGINLVLTIPFFFYLLRRHRKVWQRASLVLALGLIMYNILLTNTRGTFLVAAVTGGLCVWFGLFKIRTPHVLAALMALVLLIPAVPEDIINRTLTPRNYTMSSAATLRIRLRYWEAGLRILQDHFLFGVGVGNEKAVPAYMENPDVSAQSVHNIYLQVALETGIFGWLSFFGFVGLIFFYVRAAARNLRHRAGWEDEYYLLVAIQTAMLAVLVDGLQLDVFNFSLKGWWLMATIAPVLYGWSRVAPRPIAPAAAPEPGSFHPLPAR